MPYICVKAILGEVQPSTKIFGLRQGEIGDLSRVLTPFGGRVGQDGETYLNTPVQVKIKY